MSPEEPIQNPAPIRGWLAVFAGWELVEFAAHFAGCFAHLEITGAPTIMPAFVPAIQLDIIHTAWMVVIGIGLKRIMQRNERTRQFWIVALVASVPIMGYQMLLSYQLLSMTAGTGLADSPNILRGTLWRLAMATVFIGYWVRSKRVQQTFSRTTARPELAVTKAASKAVRISRAPLFQPLSAAIKQLPVGRFVVLEVCLAAAVILLRQWAARTRVAVEAQGKLAEEALATADLASSRELFNASWARSAELYRQAELLDALSWIPVIAVVVGAWIWFGRRTSAFDGPASKPPLDKGL